MVLHYFIQFKALGFANQNIYIEHISSILMAALLCIVRYF